ncbi:MAG: hypothetical protein HWE22_10325 [Flavobacteriales bacterium]|nr:hypothetical protein [Flavobacteriales bacterium]
MMKYTAISIGPIYPTVLQAKSTKAFWAVSYLFSYIMKNMLRELNLPVEQFVVPYFDEDDLSNDHYPVTGLFHDQFIVEGTPDVHGVFDTVVQELADAMARDLKVDQNQVREYCKSYFNLHVISGIELDEDTLEDSIIHSISPLIDTAELTNRINPLGNETYLQNFLEMRPEKGKAGSKYNYLHRKAFQYRNFPSTAEIATEELRTKKESFYASAVEKYLQDENVDGQLEFYRTVRAELERSKHSRYRKYLKHYAIVEADGDGFGNFIKTLAERDRKKPLANGEKRMDRFSKNTLQFSRAATILINGGNREKGTDKEGEISFPLKLRGHAVYAGGDDLLFFSSVAYSTFDEAGKLTQQETIFDLIEAIDAVFDQYFTHDPVFGPIIEETPVSMSYGIAISYYKFPLAEAKELSHKALADIAKKTPKQSPLKNRVVLEFRGHSGDQFTLNLRKHPTGKIYQAFRKLSHSVVNDSNYINSLMPTLEKNIGTFYGIGSTKSTTGGVSNEELRNSKWDHFFKENFNESVHTTGSGENKQLIPFLRHLKAVFQAVYSESPIPSELDSKQEDAQNHNLENWQTISGMLKFISFIHNKDN